MKARLKTCKAVFTRSLFCSLSTLCLIASFLFSETAIADNKLERIIMAETSTASFQPSEHSPPAYPGGDKKNWGGNQAKEDTLKAIALAVLCLQDVGKAGSPKTADPMPEEDYDKLPPADHKKGWQRKRVENAAATARSKKSSMTTKEWCTFCKHNHHFYMVFYIVVNGQLVASGNPETYVRVGDEWRPPWDTDPSTPRDEEWAWDNGNQRWIKFVVPQIGDNCTQDCEKKNS